MTSQTVNSPQVYARIGGALYLFIIIAGLYDEAFVRGSLIVAGDAGATAQKIMGSESRAGRSARAAREPDVG